MSDQLTIVLTLKDRGAFTYRWMRYMDDVRCPYPILIADGGEDARLESHLQQREEYPHLHYSYLRYPIDHDYGTYYRKLADVADLVSTPYVLLADNDDFFLLEHVPAFIAFLDSHADFVSCGGKPIVLRLFSAENTLVGLPSADRYEAEADDRPKSVSADSAVDRLCYFLTHMKKHGLWSSWYHVHRTAAVQQALSLVRRHEFTDPVAFEVHMHLALLMTGNYQELAVPFWVAQRGSSQIVSAIEATGNVIERFIASNSLADLNRSVASFAGLSDNDRTSAHKAIATWFADYAIGLYPARRPAPAPPADDAIERAYRSARRLLHPLKRLLWRKRVVAPPPLRLPALEKYILETPR